ncbi:hypothetical protein ABIC47_001432 [Leifsonia sp. 563]|uniref:hypothetical protein n=1 Tax=Leifsonia sp. 563 TaxID=3156412 RepID=UPI0033922CAE
MNNEPYSRLPGLEAIYLEDSWVLSIEVVPGRIEFELEAVLMRHHPEYRPPTPGQAHCYRPATLTFGDVSGVEWSAMRPPTVDASGEIDYGNIDSLTRSGEHYDLEGDWGEMRVQARTFGFALRPLLESWQPGKEGENAYCRVCGYESPEPPWGNSGVDPSWESCPCCGVEYGYQDATAEGVTRFRARWLNAGAQWVDPSIPEDGLTTETRLRRVPNPLE